MKVIQIDKIDNTLPTKFINNEGLTVAVVNMQIASELQMMSEYSARPSGIINPNQIYYIGMCGGHYIYVDPNLTWNNTIIVLVEKIEDYRQ